MLRTCRSGAVWASILVLGCLGVMACDDTTGSGDDMGVGGDGDAVGPTDAGDMGTATATDTGIATDTGMPDGGDTGVPPNDMTTMPPTDMGMTDGGDMPSDMTDMVMPPSCIGVMCPGGQHCEVDAMTMQPVCVNDTCADLMCAPTEVCQQPMGAGPAVCVDVSCASDLDCAAGEYCDMATTLCVMDACTPGETSCSGQDVLVCVANGSGTTVQVTCNSPTSFMSTCVTTAPGEAGCGCEDDWDCPAFMACEVGVCQGTGQAPTCSLPAVPFSSVPPNPEIVWGDPTPLPAAIDSPVPNAKEVVVMPAVANLDDDNGDGLINELDFPEIIFISYEMPSTSPSARADGVLRAISTLR